MVGDGRASSRSTRLPRHGKRICDSGEAWKEGAMAATKLKRPWVAFALTAITTAVAVVVSLNFVTPETRIDAAPKRLYSLQDPQFRRAINSLLGPAIIAGNKVTTLRNGDEIFPAMLAAIRGAKRSITFESLTAI